MRTVYGESSPTCPACPAPTLHPSSNGFQNTEVLCLQLWSMKSSLKTSVIGRKDSANIRESLRAGEKIFEAESRDERLDTSFIPSVGRSSSSGVKSDSSVISSITPAPSAAQTNLGKITELERENKYLQMKVHQMSIQLEKLRVENLSLIRTASMPRRARRSKHRSREHKSKRGGDDPNRRSDLLEKAPFPIGTVLSPSKRKTDRIELIILAESVVRGFNARTRFQNICARREAARELLRTEQTYNSHLQLVVKMYLNPLRELAKTVEPSSAGTTTVGSTPSLSMTPSVSPTGGPLTLAQINTMFGNIDEVLAVSYEFLMQLEQRLQHWHAEQLICDALLEMVNSFDCIVDFVKFFDVSQRAIRSCVQSNPWFANYLRIVGLLSDRKTLGDLLILPVQRCPRYILILHRLLKHTPPNHPDRKSTVEALEKLLTLTEYIEQKKKLSEDLLVDAPKPANEVSAMAARILLREGMLVDVDDNSERFVVLFNDAIVASQDKASHGSRVGRRPTTTAPVKLKSLNEMPLTHLATVTTEPQVTVGGQTFKYTFTVALRNKARSPPLTPPLPDRAAPPSTGGLFSPRSPQIDSEGFVVVTQVTYSCKSQAEQQAWADAVGHAISVLRECEVLTGGLERPALLNRNSWKHIKHVVRNNNAAIPFCEDA